MFVPQNIPIFLAFLAFFGWGIADVVGIFLFRKNSPATLTFYSGIFRMVIWLFFMPLFLKDFGKISFVPLVFNLIAGLSSGLGYVFYGKATRYTNPTIVAALGGGWGAMALVYSLFIFKENITTYQWVAILFVCLGLILNLFKREWVKEVFTNEGKGLFYSMCTLLLWGLCGATLKIPALAYGWYWTSLLMLLPYMVLIFIDTRNNKEPLSFRIHHLYIFIAMVILIILGDLGYNSGFTFGGSVAIIGTIGGSYAVLTTALSYIVYKEPLTDQQKLGVVISLIGIVLTAYFSSVI